MQNTIKTFAKSLLLMVVLWTAFSCSKDENLSDLNTTLFVRHKGADMPAYIHGNASEKIFLIILHGGPGGIGLTYRANTIKSDIEKECAVVYFDQRGSGMAQGSYSEDGINLEIMAEDVLALVKVIKHKYGNDSRFFLMGHSWGGTLGIATLLKDQTDFLGWIQVDGTHNPQGVYASYITNFKRLAPEQIAIGNDIDFWESAIDLVNRVSPQYNRKDASAMNRRAFEAEIKLERSDVINATVNDDSAFFKYNILTMFWNISNTQSKDFDQDVSRNVDFTDSLSKITVPSLVLWGKYDMVVPPIFAPAAFDNLGSDDKELIIFERSAHSPMFSEPDLFADVVIQFINQHR